MSCNFEWEDTDLGKKVPLHRCGEHKGHNGSHYCGDVFEFIAGSGRAPYKREMGCRAEFFIAPPTPTRRTS